jgi:cobalamin biosynthesis protein CobT
MPKQRKLTPKQREKIAVAQRRTAAIFGSAPVFDDPRVTPAALKNAVHGMIVRTWSMIPHVEPLGANAIRWSFIGRNAFTTHDWAFKNGHTVACSGAVNLPALPAKGTVSRALAMRYIGYTLHEIGGHWPFTCPIAWRQFIRHTSGFDWKDAHRGVSPAYAKSILNALEDVRIERNLIAAGFARGAGAALAATLEQITEEAREDGAFDDLHRFQSFPFALAYGLRAHCAAADEIADGLPPALRAILEIGRDGMAAIPVDDWRSGTRRVADLAGRIIDELCKLPHGDEPGDGPGDGPGEGGDGDEPGQPGDEPGQPGDDGDDGQPGEGEGGGEDDDDAAGPPTNGAKPGNGEPGDDGDDDGQPGDGEPAEGEGEGGEGGDDGERGDDGDDGDGRIRERGGPGKGGKGGALRGEGEEQKEPSGRMDDDDGTRDPNITLRGDVSDYATGGVADPQLCNAPSWSPDPNLRGNMLRQYQFPVLRNLLRRILENTDADSFEGGRRAGRLNPSALPRIATGADTVFRRRDYRDGVKSAVAICVDGSGSMMAQIRHATDSALVLMETVASAGADVEVSRFSDPYGQSSVIGNPLASGTVDADDAFDAEDEADGAFPGAYDIAQCRLTFAKRFDEPVARAYERYNGFAQVNGCTPDLPALVSVGRRILARDAGRRVVIFITDGAGAPVAQMQQAARVLTDQGIILIGIGIGYPLENEAYAYRCTVQSAAELGGVAMRQLLTAVLADVAARAA